MLQPRIAPLISPEDYARAWQFYRANPHTVALANHMGWGQDRTNRAIYVGYPDHGMLPLIERYRAMVEEMAKIGEQEHKRALQQLAAQARTVQIRAFGEIMAAFEKADCVDMVKKKKIMPKALEQMAGVFDKMARLANFADGGPDSRGELSIPGSMSVDDMAALMLAATGEAYDVHDAEYTEVDD